MDGITPQSGINVVIKRGTTVVYNEVTDQFGFYHWNFKQTGKGTLYNVNLPGVTAETIAPTPVSEPLNVTLGANKFVRLDFELLP